MGFVGAIVVLVCVFGGYIAAGGHIHAIFQPFEVLIIFGAALGGYVTANPMGTAKTGFKHGMKAMLGKGPNKKDYTDLLQLMFQLFQIFRKDGPQAVEKHIEEPDNSEIFKSYPSFLKNHHAVEFLCDTMKITLSADLTQYDVDDLLDQDIKVIHEEEHDAMHIVSSKADAMVSLGIVDAYLDVVCVI